MLKNRVQKRHQMLLKAARHIVGRRLLVDTDFSTSPAEIVALAFGWYGLRIDDDEALDYLNAVLAERGFPLQYKDGAR
jgi:hypothetical protein